MFEKYDQRLYNSKGEYITEMIGMSLWWFVFVPFTFVSFVVITLGLLGIIKLGS